MGHLQPTCEEKEEEPSGWGGIPIPGGWPRGDREGREDDGKGWRYIDLQDLCRGRGEAEGVMVGCRTEEPTERKSFGLLRVGDVFRGSH